MNIRMPNTRFPSVRDQNLRYLFARKEYLFARKEILFACKDIKSWHIEATVGTT